MMLMSPAAPHKRGSSSSGGRSGAAASHSWHQAPPPAQPDFMPDVRSLGEALEVPRTVVDLQNAVGNRVTLRLSGGGSLRVSLPCAPTGPLAKAGLQALQEVLPGETWWALYGRWLATEGSSSGDSDAQWQALAGVVLAWAADPAWLSAQRDDAPRLPRPSGASSGGTTTTTTATATPQRQHSTSMAPAPAGPAAWQQLLRSDHHRRQVARFAWAAPARLAAQDQTQQQQQEKAAAAAGASGRDEVWRALQALHSVYEDCKMSVLRWRLLPTLGSALLRLAGVLGLAATPYADHYCRDLGLPSHPAAVPSTGSTSSISSTGAGTAASTAPPADMFRALQQLLAGQREGGGAAPLLAQQRAPCVRRSADLLAAYALLAEAAASLSCGSSATQQPEPTQAADLLERCAHRIVRLLVRQHWTLADLDVLPWGVALPLRQAIQHCRGNPPTDWPQEAYVLIGRNDIAASMAAAEQEERPAEAAVSSIVSTPLGKMAKTTSPKKAPRQSLGGGVGAAAMHTPTGGPTPAGGHGLRLSALSMGATPPMASATRQPQHAQHGGSYNLLLSAPEGDASRVLAAPELQTVPYAQRLQLPAAAAGGAGGGEADKPTGGEGTSATVVASASGVVTAAGDPEVGDGMENLAQQAASLRFGRDLRLAEVRRLLRSSSPVTLHMGNVPEASDAEGTAAQQLKLTVLAIRSCALPLGRGALTLGTLRPLPTEPLHIPPLCLGDGREGWWCACVRGKREVILLAVCRGPGLA